MVFALFSDADQLATWWGPEGFSVPSLSFEPRAGEPFRIEMQPPEGDAFHLRGEFREVDPPRRLAYTFVWDPPDPDDVETLVELSFAEVGGGTAVRLRQGTFKTERAARAASRGWTESFDKLQRRMSAT